MSAIGNYIHYSSQGYLDHGITLNGKYKEYASQKNNILSKARKNSSTSLNNKEKKELEQILTSMTTAGVKSTNKYIVQAQQAVTKKMNELFGEALGDINWETGDITFKTDRSNMIGRAYSAINEQDILNRIDRVEKVLIQKMEEGAIGTSEVKKQLQQLRQGYTNTIKQIKADKEARGLPTTLTSADAAKGLSQYRNQLNEIIQEWAAFPAVYLQKGTFFEHLITYAPVVAEQNAKAELGKVIGDCVEDVKLDLNKFENKYLTKQFKDSFLETTRVSQGKIDVEMKWKSKDLKISAKNVNLNNRYVQLLSGSSLLNLLQDESANFVNHALNILSTHKGNMDKINAMRPDMIQELRLIILYKALTGDVGGRKSANLFIANDNKTGQVKVHNVSDIINKANTNLSRGVAIKGVNLSMKKFLNTYATTPEERISRLLADVHARKISVGLNTSLL